jgi:hypothetical protein
LQMQNKKRKAEQELKGNKYVEFRTDCITDFPLPTEL